MAVFYLSTFIRNLRGNLRAFTNSLTVDSYKMGECARKPDEHAERTERIVVNCILPLHDQFQFELFIQILNNWYFDEYT